MAQIGTVKVETAGGPVELPVYELGDSGSNRIEAFRVQTASGPGFVPLTDVSAADRPYLRVQTGNGVKAFDTSASGIPDSGDLYAPYDWQEASGTSTVNDQTGNGRDLTGTYTGPTETINGFQAGAFDETDDVLSVDFSAISQPFTIFMVWRPDTVGTSSEYVLDGGSSNEAAFRSGGGNWVLNAGGGSVDDNNDVSDNTTLIGEVLFNSANSAGRANDTEVVAGNPGSDDLTGLTINQRGDRSDVALAGWTWGEMLVYPSDKTGIRQDVYSYFESRWGSILP